MIHFPDNLKLLRKKASVSQEELGLRVNKRGTAISAWERGESEPSMEDLEIICGYFGVLAHDLLFADLTDVHLLERSKTKENVHLNVHPSVHLSTKKGQKTANEQVVIPALEKALSESQKSNEYLGIAVKGLEASNAMLIRENQSLKEENALLKRGTPQVGGQMDSDKARAAG